MTLREVRAQITAIGRDSWLLFVAITVANASNYVFHVVISRLLEPSDYGAFNAVLAILIWLSVPLGAVQTTIAKRLAQNDGVDSVSSWPAMTQSLLPVGVVVTVALLAASPFLASFLRLDSIWTALLIASYVLPAVILTACRGLLQGRLHFAQLAAVSAVPMLARLVVGIPLVKLGAGVEGALGASIVAEVVGTGLALWLIARNGDLVLRWSKVDWGFLRETLPILTALAAMWLLIELDLILARRYLASAQSGTYAAAGVLARAVLFVPGAVSLVALPHFSRDRGRGTDAHRWLMSSAALVVGLGAAVAAVLAVASRLAITITFGESYLGAAAFLPLLSFAMVGLGLANLLVFFHIAAGSRVFQLLWLIALAEAVAMVIWHDGGQTLTLIVLATSWLAALVTFLAARSVALSPSLQWRLPEEVRWHRGEGVDREQVPDVSLVIPSYNGGAALARTVSASMGVLEACGRSYEVIVVSDGSTDSSAREVANLAGAVDVLHYTRRSGKGVALRVGMTRARGRYIAFVDGDGELDASELRSFLGLMEMYDPDMVIGSKRHPLSNVYYPVTRRVMSWCYQRLVRVLFGLNIRDTQTGMKLIRRDVIDVVLPRMLEKRFAFDLEFLVVAKRAGYTRFFEAPVTIQHKFSSTISVRSAARILIDTAAIYYRRYVLRFYDYPGPERPEGSPGYSAQLAGLAETGAGS